MKGPSIAAIGALRPSVHYLPRPVTDLGVVTRRSYPHSKRVGFYLLGKTIGEGSFAKVKEALHMLTGEKVAIKIVNKKKAEADAYVRRHLRREGQLLQLIRHCHVVSLFEIMETENSYYLVMELCSGGSLMEHIARKGRLAEHEARHYVRQMVSAVHYMHRMGIVHRDLKAENLLLDDQGDLKIIDFGLSTSVRVNGSIEQPDTSSEFCMTQCGSPAYVAPELLGQQKYGPKVDVWGIGVNLFAMLTGRLPFTVDPFSIKTLHRKMINREMNPLPDHLTQECKNFILRLLTPAPESRIELEDAMSDPWITTGLEKPMQPSPFPNKMEESNMDGNILAHMTHNMGFQYNDVIRFVTNNVSCTIVATYQLLQRRLTKHMRRAKVLDGKASGTSFSVSKVNSYQRRKTTLSLLEGPAQANDVETARMDKPTQVKGRITFLHNVNSSPKKQNLQGTPKRTSSTYNECLSAINQTKSDDVNTANEAMKEVKVEDAPKISQSPAKKLTTQKSRPILSNTMDFSQKPVSQQVSSSTNNNTNNDSLNKLHGKTSQGHFQPVSTSASNRELVHRITPLVTTTDHSQLNGHVAMVTQSPKRHSSIDCTVRSPVLTSPVHSVVKGNASNTPITVKALHAVGRLTLLNRERALSPPLVSNLSNDKAETTEKLCLSVAEKKPKGKFSLPSIMPSKFAFKKH